MQPTCQNIATAAFLSEMATAGWVPVAVPDSSSFDGFPGGRPSRSISCTWSADPTVGTDNVAIRAWAAIDPATASAAIQHYVDAGWIRVDAPEGTYVGVKGDGGPVSPDAEGFNETYLFTKTDVRFADSKASLKDVKAPTEAG
ncbi:MAG: hypothetical protein J0I70_12505 [Microbacterium sp.]|uniref:hypothetical protein n=1 Tax=Microbacterium sp. TaxID=51671 RepID=UPI001AD4315A|nr:hypothetical protein [Microbacterium sp.]MBN9153049.1 hypothetical protein [Microbacterium sp.]MBN9174960.1 hypothetical protein [Microbacterium sp.]MBN9183346.1 hypothetical protein [Microbacterium sp.]